MLCILYLTHFLTHAGCTLGCSLGYKFLERIHHLLNFRPWEKKTIWSKLRIFNSNLTTLKTSCREVGFENGARRATFLVPNIKKVEHTSFEDENKTKQNKYECVRHS